MDEIDLMVHQKMQEISNREAQIEAYFIDNLPSWNQVSTAVDNIANLADAKAFLKKLARITYWLARDKED